MNKTFNFYKKVLSYFRPFRWVLFISFILSLLPAVIVSINQFFLGKISDGLFLNDVDQIKLFTIILLSMLALRQVIWRMSTIFDLKKIEFTLGHHLSRTALEKSFGLSFGQLKQEHSGFKQDVLRNGSSQMNQLMFIIMYDIVPLVATTISSFIGLYFLNATLLYISLAYTVVYLVIGLYLNSKVHEPLKEIIKKRTESNKTFVDILQNLFLLKFSNKMQIASDHFYLTQDDHAKLGIKTWVKYNYQQIFLDALFVGYFVIGVVFSLRYIEAGIITPGMFIPITVWLFAISQSIAQIRQLQRRIMIAESDVEKMFTMFEQKSDIELDINARTINVFENKITFESVNFDYKEGKKNALKDINFEIKKGDKVALVGRSGSGKTTIVSLLLRLYDPTQGALMIDGVELKALVLEDWHNMIAYVPQDSDLLDISIKENILFGAKHEVTEQELEDVLDKAGIKEFIENLPQGIDTIVGEKGVKLSGGQKQRVCIARALIKNAPILLLDEATSSLDSETETFVNKAIWDMLGDKTGVVIAHRLSTILDADKIVVMDQGQIVGIGTHKQLLKSTPYYKILVDAQNVNL